MMREKIIYYDVQSFTRVFNINMLLSYLLTTIGAHLLAFRSEVVAKLNKHPMSSDSATRCCTLPSTVLLYQSVGHSPLSTTTQSIAKE